MQLSLIAIRSTFDRDLSFRRRCRYRCHDVVDLVSSSVCVQVCGDGVGIGSVSNWAGGRSGVDCFFSPIDVTRRVGQNWE